jgi:cellulose biosynthesis protein BcsQ
MEMTTDLSTSGTVITFYSYKGGTGRSMALANAACLMVGEGALKSQKVLVIDWDLEAPGLHRFFLRTEEPEHPGKPGIINYFERLQELLKTDPTLRDQIAAEQGWTALSTALPIEDYIILDVASGVDLIRRVGSILNTRRLLDRLIGSSFTLSLVQRSKLLES